MTREHTIQNAILRTFGTRPDLRIWRMNTGRASFGGRSVQFGVPGQADLTGILPVEVYCPRCIELIARLGVRLEIEVKSETGRQSEDQQNYQAIIERFGGLYVLARSVEDVNNAIEEYRNGQ